MAEFSFSTLLNVISLALTIGGMVCLIAGVYILVRRAHSRELDIVAEQTGRAVQKNLGSELNTLITNASGLIDSLNNLVKTRAGIGGFLCIIGFLQLATALSIIYRMQ